MNRRSPLFQALLALALYGGFAAVIMVHGASLTHQLSGQGSDPYDSPWFLAWWPFALSHHQDPFFTRLIWYPYGVSLLWVTSVPLLSLLCWPITAAFGAVLSYNLLIVTAPVLGAWCAYFVCRRLTRDFTAALIGGYLFGFSTYETSQSIGALNLTIIFVIPLLLLVVLKRLDDELSRPAAVALAALLLLAQFLICIEIFAMIFVFGGLAWGLALFYMPERRLALRRLFVDALYAGPCVALPLAPLFVAMARHYGLINHPAAWPDIFVTDLVGVVVPTSLNLFGHPFQGLAGGVAGDTQESCGYLGLPLLAIIFMFGRQRGMLPAGRYIVVMFLLCLIFSFGPFLWVAGHFTGIALPWLAVMQFPLMGSALPARFALFTSLAAALIVTHFLAMQPGRRWAPLALALVACVSLLPQPHPWRALPESAFFAPGRVQQVLGPDPRLLILPFAINGPSSFWQMENNYGFTQVGGYLGFPPKPAQKYQAVGEMFGNMMKPGFLTAFVKYAQENGAQYLVAGPGADPKILAAIATLGWPERRVDDVIIFSVPGAA